VHVTLIVMTGFVRNMNHIVMGTDDHNYMGMILGFVGIGVVLVTWVGAHLRLVVKASSLAACAKVHNIPFAAGDVEPARTQQALLRAGHLSAFLAERQDAGARGLEAVGQRRISEVQVEGGGPRREPGRAFSCRYRKGGSADHIIMHHCIQGWTGIAKWGGLPMKSLVELVRPKANARTVAFFSYGGSLSGGAYYDTQSMENVSPGRMPACYRDERKALTEVYGAALRLRVENQLGFKMVK
jgi:sulfoxide reductase catalytic subunit YedY